MKKLLFLTTVGLISLFLGIITSLVYAGCPQDNWISCLTLQGTPVAADVIEIEQVSDNTSKHTTLGDIVNDVAMTRTADIDMGAKDLLFSATGGGMIYGSMYNTAQFTVPISTTNPTEVNDGTATFDGWTTGLLNGMTFPGGGTEHYLTITLPGVYRICWSLSTNRGGGASMDTHGGVMIDDVAVRWNGEDERKLSSLDVGAYGTCSLHDLTSGDEEISLWVIMSDGAEDAVIEHANLVAELIGGT